MDRPRARLPPRPWRISPLRQLLLQVISVGVLLTVMYLPTSAYAAVPNPWSKLANTLYTALGRPAWGLAIATLMLVCSLSRRNYMNRILSVGAWEPLSRLSYAAFLLHPVILEVLNFSRTDYFRASPSSIAVCFAAAVTLSFSVSGVLFLAVEQPAKNLCNLAYALLAGTPCCFRACGCRGRGRGSGSFGSRHRSKLDSELSDAVLH